MTITRPAGAAAPLISASFVGGLALYVIAFFLPAVGTYNGWQCARIVSDALISWPRTVSQANMVVIALLNPMVVLFVVSELTGRIAAARPTLTVLIPIAIAATWAFLFGSEGDNLGIQIGHMLWIAGILLIVAPELARWQLIGPRPPS